MIPPAIFNNGTLSIFFTNPSITGLHQSPLQTQGKGVYFDTFSYIAPLRAHHDIALPLCLCSSFSNFPSPLGYPLLSPCFLNSIAAYSMLNPNNHGHQLLFAFRTPPFLTYRCIIKAYNNGRRIYIISAYHDKPLRRGSNCEAGLMSSTVRTLENK